MVRRARLPWALLSCALLAVAGCDGDDPDPPPIVYVEIGGLPNPFTTTMSSVALRAAVGWEGPCDAAGFSGSWSNAATGDTGALAFDTVTECIPLIVCFCEVRGTASVPVIVGNNLVTATVTAPNGGVGEDSILVVRNAI